MSSFAGFGQPLTEAQMFNSVPVPLPEKGKEEKRPGGLMQLDCYPSGFSPVPHDPSSDRTVPGYL